MVEKKNDEKEARKEDRRRKRLRGRRGIKSRSWKRKIMKGRIRIRIFPNVTIRTLNIFKY